MPKRIQLRRTKGWRKPEGAIYVGRPGKWGNPYHIRHTYADPDYEGGLITVRDAVHAVEPFKRGTLSEIIGNPLAEALIATELRGHDLACWCPLYRPCHADVLLEIANA